MTEKEALETIMYPKQAMNRFIEPEEVASGVVYLASRFSQWYQQENILVYQVEFN